MQMDKSLIEKFLENRCTAEEARQVHHYLNEHPDLLRNLYQRDWDHADDETPLDSTHAAKMYEAIHDRIHVRKMPVLRYMPWVAAAAVIILVLGVWLYRSPQPATPSSAQVASVTKQATKATQPIATTVNWQQQDNTTGAIKKVQLPDGSIVSLSPAAVIKYAAAFEAGKRDVILEGEAFFEVVKDKTRPFTVYSGSLSTTALGTSFRVTSTAAAVRVQLMTGKVVIRAVRQLLRGWDKDVYLLPGQQMKYDAVASLVKVSNTPANRQATTTASVAYDPGEEMVFDNAPLPQVLDKLIKHYKVTIDYTAEELNGLSFSGTIFYNDPLPVILQAIGRMNDLSVTTVDDGFRIKKRLKE